MGETELSVIAEKSLPNPSLPQPTSNKEPGADPLEARTEAGDWVRLQRAPLDSSQALRFLRGPRAGGIGFFLGVTRRFTEKKGGDERETTRLDYEAYRPMALRELERLAGAARERWPSMRRAVLFHRLGPVPPAEASVAVGAATPHRAEAFAAARFLIDTLKEQVPIWKREHLSSGEVEWVEGGALPNVE